MPTPGVDVTRTPAAVRLCDLTDDREAETVAGPGSVGAVEAIEHAVQLAGRDARALVGDGRVHPAVDAVRRQLDPRLLGRVLERVVEEVRERALELSLVADDPEAGLELALDADVAELRDRRELVGDLGADGSHVDLALERARALESREREQVADDAGHAVGRPADHRRVLAQALGSGVGLGERDVEVRLDDRQRVAQLV